MSSSAEKRLHREIQKVRKEFHVIKKNPRLKNIETQIKAIVKSGNVENLALVILHVLAGVFSYPQKTKQLKSLLRESIDSNEFSSEIDKFIELLLQEIESNINIACNLKVKDLLVK
jgi:hypothetical protein